MQSQTSQPLSRRTHDAKFKASVIAACREPGASVAAVAQAHGLNANLVRKWLVGRGVKRCGLDQDGAAASNVAGARAMAVPVPAIPFVPVQVPQAPPERGETIEIELTRSGATLNVRWPAAQASACASWLGELAQVLSR
ncbi:MAG: transposase [Ramlibacter sp.]